MPNVDLQHLEALRRAELEGVLALLQKYSFPGARLLEIGAGSGWQSRLLADAGFCVSAIDIESSTYHENRVWPVIDYDGVKIPFSSAEFDVVFSSNVLEHVGDVDNFEAEICRVLTGKGVVVHLLPSSSWRFWTSLSHYPYLAKSATFWLIGRFRQARKMGAHEGDSTPRIRTRSICGLLRVILFPRRHGERGSVMSELHYFSQAWWRRHFIATNWRIVEQTDNNLFYTGYSVLGALLTIEGRRRLAAWLGGSCNTFVLRKSEGVEFAESTLAEKKRAPTG